MSKIVFFCIPAHGHTNPTIPVVRELTRLGHEVWYYSFAPFCQRIEAAGARFIGCDAFLPPLRPEDEQGVGKDFALLIEMVADTTIALDERVCADLRAFRPDVVVSDSVCFWGKLFARKLDLPFVCSTTSFAFNQHTARLMKRSPMELVRMITGMPRIQRKMKLLREHGYQLSGFVSIIQNDNDTDAVVYTSREFQPMSDTFSNRYAFVGPSLDVPTSDPAEKLRKRVYVSLGTVLNNEPAFYRSCIEALRTLDVDVVMSVGKQLDLSTLGELPPGFDVQPRVDQLRVLQRADAFITHSGMNSANESLYFGVPMVLFPRHEEQRMVARRVTALGAGVMLPKPEAASIRSAVLAILNDASFRASAQRLSEGLRTGGGAPAAAEAILRVANRNVRRSVQ